MAVNHQLEEGIKSGKYGPYDYRIVRRDGSIRYIHALGETHFNQEGQPLRMMGTVQDITELKQAEEALKESRNQASLQLAEIESIYYSAAVGLAVLDDKLPIGASTGGWLK